MRGVIDRVTVAALFCLFPTFTGREEQTPKKTSVEVRRSRMTMGRIRKRRNEWIRWSLADIFIWWRNLSRWNGGFQLSTLHNCMRIAFSYSWLSTPSLPPPRKNGFIPCHPIDSSLRLYALDDFAHCPLSWGPDSCWTWKIDRFSLQGERYLTCVWPGRVLSLVSELSVYPMSTTLEIFTNYQKNYNQLLCPTSLRNSLDSLIFILLYYNSLLGVKDLACDYYKYISHMFQIYV